MGTDPRSGKRRKSGGVDLERILATTDEEIARQIADDPDTASEITEDDLDRAWIVETDGSRKRYRDVVPRKERV